MRLSGNKVNKSYRVNKLIKFLKNLNRHLAKSYALVHKTMTKGEPKKCANDDDDFSKQGGITNGAAWYSVSGGMQDFNYLGSNDFEITLELGCDKYPPRDQLENEWENNRDALLNFIKQVRSQVLFEIFENIFGLVSHWDQRNC